MPAEFDPQAIEAKWQKKWEEARVFEIDFKNAKNPYYGLVMYPYPSGDKLHVGHWYNFGPADSYFRFQKMQGKDVFTPMG
ncbi:MAG: class I tRNA ligase family protein, partial [Patescibacteria group bacterium]